MNAHTARMLARAPLGAAAERRYGAPYWVIHRGDLQAVLLEAVARIRASRSSSARGSTTTRFTATASRSPALRGGRPFERARHRA